MTSDNQNIELSCDFCNRPLIAWKYPCLTFSLEPLQGYLSYTSNSYWAACEECADYIEKGKLDTLAFLISGLQAAARMSEPFDSETEVAHIILYGEIRDLWREFSKHRTGDRVLA